MIPVLAGTCTVYVETLEAAAAVALLTNKRLVWRRHPNPGAGRASEPAIQADGSALQHRPAPASIDGEA